MCLESPGDLYPPHVLVHQATMVVALDRAGGTRLETGEQEAGGTTRPVALRPAYKHGTDDHTTDSVETPLVIGDDIAQGRMDYGVGQARGTIPAGRCSPPSAGSSLPTYSWPAATGRAYKKLQEDISLVRGNYSTSHFLTTLARSSYRRGLLK